MSFALTARRSIRGRRSRRRISRAFDLQLTSMLDILVIILVFLLKSYQARTHEFNLAEGMKIPMSRSMNAPHDSFHISVTPAGITFEDEKIVLFDTQGDLQKDTPIEYQIRKQDLTQAGRRIVPLFDTLVKARDQSELLRAKSQARDTQGRPLPFDGVLAISADQRVKYDTIRKVMYTAGEAGFRVFLLLARKLE